MQLTIADTSFVLEFDSNCHESAVRPLCAAFMRGGYGEPCRLSVRETAISDRPSNVTWRESEGLVELFTPAFTIRIDTVPNCGEILLESFSPELFLRALRNVVTYDIIKRGGMVMHASGVVREERAYVFPGRSGCGKSTIARLSVDDTVLSQEFIGILPASDGWRACGLPYAEDAEFTRRSGASHPLAAVLLPVQDKRHELRPLEAVQALAMLFNMPAGMNLPIQYACTLNRYGRLVETARCYTMHFLPDAGFWHEIRKNMDAEVAI